MATYHTLGLVQLPRGLVWADEHDWAEAEQSTEYSITGALLVDAQAKDGGRPITLQAEDDAGWMRRDTLAQLRALANVPGATYPLTLADGRTFTVLFAPGQPITAHPIGRPELPGSNHPYVATVRLLEAPSV